MKKFRIVTVLLALCLITSSFVGGTFAKYTSEASGSDTAIVAKWSILYKANDVGDGEDIPKIDVENKNITFDLFNTVNGTEEITDNDVRDADEGDDPIIAPGTTGSFMFTIKNESDVTAKYGITFAQEGAEVPIQYSIQFGDGEQSEWATDISDLNVAMGDATKLNVDSEAVTYTVYWKWVFDSTTDTVHENQTDASDTELGIAAGTVTVTATINVEQVD